MINDEYVRNQTNDCGVNGNNLRKSTSTFEFPPSADDDFRKIHGYGLRFVKSVNKIFC